MKTLWCVVGADDARGQVHVCGSVVPAGGQDGGWGGHRGGRQARGPRGDRPGDGALHFPPRYTPWTT